MPDQWNNYRDIDEVINLDEINRNLGFGVEDGESEEEDVI